MTLERCYSPCLPTGRRGRIRGVAFFGGVGGIVVPDGKPYRPRVLRIDDPWREF